MPSWNRRDETRCMRLAHSAVSITTPRHAGSRPRVSLALPCARAKRSVWNVPFIGGLLFSSDSTRQNKTASLHNGRIQCRVVCERCARHDLSDVVIGFFLPARDTIGHSSEKQQLLVAISLPPCLCRIYVDIFRQGSLWKNGLLNKQKCWCNTWRQALSGFVNLTIANCLYLEVSNRESALH